MRFEKHEIPLVLFNAWEQGVKGAILVGYSPDHYRSVREILDNYGPGGDGFPAIAGSIGIHPHESDNFDPAEVEGFRNEISNPDIIAIGETGLDFFRDYAKRENQIGLFRAQVRIASDTGFPLIIHSRSAFKDTMSVLNEITLSSRPGVFHCYGYGPDEIGAVIERGFFVSFAGNLTYTNADDLRGALGLVPEDKILVETDCPFLVPRKAKNRGVRRNEPKYVVETLAAVAELRGWSIESAGERIIVNTLECFPRLKESDSWRGIAKGAEN